MKFDHVVLSVRDMDASAAWYGVVLSEIGFSKSRDHVWVNDDGLAIDLRPATEPDHRYLRGGVGLNHVAFAAPSASAIEELAARLTAHGLDVPAIQSFDQARAIFLKDPDGMRIEVAHEPG